MATAAAPRYVGGVQAMVLRYIAAEATIVPPGLSGRLAEGDAALHTVAGPSDDDKHRCAPFHDGNDNDDRIMRRFLREFSRPRHDQVRVVE